MPRLREISRNRPSTYLAVFTEIIAGRLWHNPGAVGMPANDGTPRVWFSVVAPGPGYVAIEHVALDYDHRAAAAKMRAASLPDGYAEALATGLWPSCDVLPPAEAAARGVPLEAAAVAVESAPPRSAHLARGGCRKHVVDAHDRPRPGTAAA